MPLIGSMATGYGNNMATMPTAKTPNLEDASKQFVSMLYSYMFQQMRESGSDEEDGLFSGAHANMLMGFLDQEMGKKLADSEGSGLAQTLMGQLQQNAGGSEVEEAQSLTATGNNLRELTQDEVAGGIEEDNSSNQMMDELYKLNQR
ncbi:MAG: rod-binding protein [Candidatus Sericytochromatia bacterium]